MEQLDCRGMRCPMPIVKLSMAIKSLDAEAELTVTADDPAFRPDLEAWVRKTGNDLVSFEVVDEIAYAVIRKAGQ